MESYYIDALARWHYVPELAKGTNHTQWSNQVYQSTAIPPARQEKYVKSIAWQYKTRRKGKNFSRKASYTMYGLGYRKRYKR